jgi:hypothetical protein
MRDAKNAYFRTKVQGNYLNIKLLIILVQVCAIDVVLLNSRYEVHQQSGRRNILKQRQRLHDIHHYGRNQSLELFAKPGGCDDLLNPFHNRYSLARCHHVPSPRMVLHRAHHWWWL